MRIRKHFNLSAAAFCLAAFVTVADAAFTISPANLKLNVKGGQRTGWLELEHTGGGPMAIEVVAYECHIDLDGNVIRDPLIPTADFTVYPSEIVLYPGDKAKAQVMLKARGKVMADKVYYIFSKEVPLPVPDEDGAPQVRTAINVTMSYYTILTLDTGRPANLVFVSSKKIDGGMIELIVENRGGGRVSSKDVRIMVGKREITDFTGKGSSIMPGAKRRFTFKFDRPVTAKEVKFGK